MARNMWRLAYWCSKIFGQEERSALRSRAWITTGEQTANPIPNLDNG